MPIEGLQLNLDIFLRWLHVIAGIAWIGHLYFFNFVNLNFQAKLDGPTKKVVNPQLLSRALFWFRWGAMITFLAGLVLFTFKYMYVEGKGFGPSPNFSIDGKIQDRAIYILGGMLFGTIMWFNVWFIIWPAQQKILPAVRDGQPVDQALVKRATLASKVNTYLSAPMLFGMLAPSHYPSINAASAIVFLVLAELTIWLAYKFAPRAGASIWEGGAQSGGGSSSAAQQK